MFAFGLPKKSKQAKYALKFGKKTSINIFLDLWLLAANQFQDLAVLQ